MKTEKYLRLTDISAAYVGKHLCAYDVTCENTNTGITRTWEVISRKGSKNSHEAQFHSIEKYIKTEPNASGITILAFNKTQDKVLLLLEYRPAIGRYVINFPQGMRKENESSEEAAIREIVEETGCAIQEIITIKEPSYTAPGFTDDTTSLVICYAYENEVMGYDAVKDKLKSTFEEIVPLWLDKTQLCDLYRGVKPNHPYWKNKPFTKIPLTMRVEMFALGWISGGFSLYT